MTDNSNRSALEQNTADFILSSDPDDAVDNSTIKFQVDGSTKAQILHSGDVGINVTPIFKLHVKDDQDSTMNNGIAIERSNV